ncbi:MAG: potassium channel family protein [bacterium]
MTKEATPPAPLQRISVWQATILFMSFYVLIALFIETVLTLPDQTAKLLNWIDNLICMLFIGDFIYQLATAKNKLGYLKWGWIDLVSSIPNIDYSGMPNIDFLRLGRFVRLIRILRILRGIRSLRQILKYLFENRAHGTFATVALISFTVMIFSSVVILNCETDPASNIKSANDALWWSVVTMATVGYGDKYPVTVGGRIVAAFLMVAGVGLFGTFTAYVASFFVKQEQKEEKKRDVEILAELKEIRQHLEQIEKHIATRGPGTSDEKPCA